MAALAVCYFLYFKSQPPAADAGRDESRPIVIAAVRSGPPDLRTVAAPHSVYKADLNRAHDAARQMQASHDEANSY